MPAHGQVAQGGQVGGGVHVEREGQVWRYARVGTGRQSGAHVALDRGRPEGRRDHVDGPQQQGIGALAIAAGAVTTARGASAAAAIRATRSWAVMSGTSLSKDDGRCRAEVLGGLETEAHRGIHVAGVRVQDDHRSQALGFVLGSRVVDDGHDAGQDVVGADARGDDVGEPGPRERAPLLDVERRCQSRLGAVGPARHDDGPHA